MVQVVEVALGETGPGPAVVEVVGLELQEVRVGEGPDPVAKRALRVVMISCQFLYLVVAAAVEAPEMGAALVAVQEVTLVDSFLYQPQI